MKNSVVPGAGPLRSHWGSFMAGIALVASACATGDSSAPTPGFDTPTISGSSGGAHDASVSSSSSASSGSSGGSGSSSGSGLNSSSDDSGGTPMAGDDGAVEGGGVNVITDDASGDDAARDSGTSPVIDASSPGSYACVTTLASPLPVCDSSHDYCLCTQDAQCNSNGLTNGGCSSGKCARSDCSGGNFADSAGCSVVEPTCNINKCPTGTTCEGGPTSGYNSRSKKSLCGTSFQCCWCTSDSACPVSGKCINDPTQKQCDGAGPCTGSGASFDGMHCQLASPGIPMCSMQ
jgi:hypothetical protein